MVSLVCFYLRYFYLYLLKCFNESCIPVIVFEFCATNLSKFNMKVIRISKNIILLFGEQIKKTIGVFETLSIIFFYSTH